MISKITVKQICYIFFFLGLFFIPFNSFEGLDFLGEFKSESAAYFFLLGFLFLLLSQKIVIPIYNFYFRLVLMFLLWCIISTLINYSNLQVSYFKHTYGFSRFYRQFLSLILSTLIFLVFYYNVFINFKRMEILIDVRRVFLISLIFVFIVGIVDILVVIFNISSFRVFFELLDYFPFFKKSYFTERITSVSAEPPFLAIYLITISGWMLSYINTNKGFIKYLPAIFIFILTYYSGSRTALIVISIQYLLYIFLTIPFYVILKKTRKFVILFSLLFSIFFLFNAEKIFKSVETKVDSLNFVENLKTNVSNQSRFGMQYASLVVFSENPIVGVGFGQQGYESRYNYPGWAVKNNWEFVNYYKNSNVPAFPPGYNIYTRLLAETGIIGFLTFILLIVLSIRKAKIIMNNNEGETKVLAIILLISLTGLYINWLQIDTFRIYGVWISLALLMRIEKNRKNESQSDSVVNTTL